MIFDIEILRVYNDLQRLVNVIQKKEEFKVMELFRLKSFKDMNEAKQFVFKTFDTKKVLSENKNECMVQVWQQYKDNKPYYKDVVNITKVYNIHVFENDVCILAALKHGVHEINSKEYDFLENKVIDKIISKPKDVIEVYIK